MNANLNKESSRALPVRGFPEAAHEAAGPRSAHEFNECLAQPRIALGGVPRDPDGRRLGYRAVIEAEDPAAATDYLQRSPYHRYDLYEVARVAEFDQELGAVELSSE